MTTDTGAETCLYINRLITPLSSKREFQARLFCLSMLYQPLTKITADANLQEFALVSDDLIKAWGLRHSCFDIREANSRSLVSHDLDS